MRCCRCVAAAAPPMRYAVIVLCPRAADVAHARDEDGDECITRAWRVTSTQAVSFENVRTKARGVGAVVGRRRDEKRTEAQGEE